MRVSATAGFRAALAMSLALAAAPVRGQELPEPGTRVRVSLTPRKDNAPILGAIAAWQPDTLVVLSDRDRRRRAIPVQEIRRFEIKTGTGPATKQGLQSGALLGGIAGLVIAARARHTETDFKYGLGISLGAASGALVGAIVGSARRTERWRDAPLPRPRAPSRLADLPASFAVRIEAPRRFEGLREGTLVSRTEDSLTFLPNGKDRRPMTLGADEVTSLEVGEGRRHHAGAGVATLGLLGAALGAGGGAAIGSMADATLAGAVLGGLAIGGIGMVAGMFLGGMVETEHWERVPLSSSSASEVPGSELRATLAPDSTATSAP